MTQSMLLTGRVFGRPSLPFGHGIRTCSPSLRVRIFSMTAAFVVIYVVSKLDNSKQAQLERSLYPAQKVRSETGFGASSASGH